MTRILAIDLALNATGIVTPDGWVDCIRPPKSLTGGDRLLWWSTTWTVILADTNPDRIVIERPFAGAIRGDSTAKLQQAYGVLLAEIARHCPAAVQTWVPPATLKKVATGNGRATKRDMIRAANDSYGHASNGASMITDDNEADAWLLWQLCTNGAFDA